MILSICKGDLNPEGITVFSKGFSVERKIGNFLEFWISNLHSNPEVFSLVKELSQKYEMGIITNNVC
jgi:FMN phosphatase YigB (HAD superfamily)